MADRNKKRSGSKSGTSKAAGRGSSSTRGGASRRGGFGDDQGTRVGSPDESGREHYGGPSTQPVKEGLEGAILEGERGHGDAEGERRSGAGTEAVRGMHEFGSGQTLGERSRTSPTDASASDNESEGSANDIERAGSEPLRGHDVEHESGYGGRGGEPRTSSDQREPQNLEGSGEE
jgi:hypothetical protein